MARGLVTCIQPMTETKFLRARSGYIVIFREVHLVVFFIVPVRVCTDFLVHLLHFSPVGKMNDRNTHRYQTLL
jgi:hypothetical protein